MNTADYLSIIPTKCDKCGKMIEDFYDKSEWWEKYLFPEENQICLNCIKERSGFKDDFQKNVGISLESIGRIDFSYSREFGR